MSYMQLFLTKIAHSLEATPYKTYETPCGTTGDPGEKISHSYPEVPTKPTKPGFVGFVGTSDQESAEILPGPSAAKPAKLFDPLGPPTWRAEIARWSIPERERWGRLANSYEDQGYSWKVAEWLAYYEVNPTPASMENASNENRSGHHD